MVDKRGVAEEGREGRSRVFVCVLYVLVHNRLLQQASARGGHTLESLPCR